ncbi:MAG: hypothetical protein M0024_00840 [Nitrospiraceae bacterium]|nr:hypothetical protein [Nitrospiraceae bacterium]
MMNSLYPDKSIMKTIKYIPSQTRHYLACPYFLKLSNSVKIPIDEPHIIGIRRTQLFKDHVIARLGQNLGKEPFRTQKLLDLILNRGLMLIAKKIETVFFSTSDIGLEIEMFKPDIIETTMRENIGVNIKSIKNIEQPEEHHYLQSIVYKLALEKALEGATLKPFKVTASLLHWNTEHYPVSRNDNDTDIEGFSSHLSNVSSQAFFSEEKIDEEQGNYTDMLRDIASLEPQDDEEKCEHCHGKFCCDVHNQIPFRDKYKWFSRFQPYE